MLRRLRRLKYGEAEVEFGEKLEEVEEDIAELPVPSSLPAAVERDESELLESYSNNSAVFVAWPEVNLQY
jgi:hypothetical protein